MSEAAGARALPTDPHDRSDMLDDVLTGLSRPQKELSPKYFYDARGSELFERITGLDAYYPTRTERTLLRRWMGAWVARHQPATLVELGAGSASKTRIILDAMHGQRTGDLYVPVDVSGAFLQDTAETLRVEYPGLRVRPQVADFSQTFRITTPLVAPTWFALLGSTIGNFTEADAIPLLRRIAGRMREGDRFLLGADRRPGPHKSVARLERAYNDEHGVTAAFNLNVLRVLNDSLGTDFDLDAFTHRAFYAEAAGRIEMHLVALHAQNVRFPGGRILELAEGETIRTEISCKYDRQAIDVLFEAAGLAVDTWVEDDEQFFTLVLGRLAD